MTAFEQLYLAARMGEFERNGRSMLLFLGPDREHNGRWTAEELRSNVMAAGGEVTRVVVRNILRCCWIPSDLARAWLVKRYIRLPEQLFPHDAWAQSRAAAPAAAKRSAPFRIDYRELDAPLVAEMHKMIGDGRATGRTDAARAVVGRAVGTGSDASKITRLIRHYNDKLPKN